MFITYGPKFWEMKLRSKLDIIMWGMFAYFLLIMRHAWGNKYEEQKLTT
jgi:hypothetical protein